MALQQNQVTKQASICKGNINTLASLALENRTKSAALVKDITALIVSSILYYRKIIPPEMFVEKKLGVQRVKILKTNTDHNLANNFCAMILSVYESIDQGYLKKMIITFLENNKPVEMHKIYFEHNGEAYKGIMVNQANTRSKIHLKHQITKLKDEIFETISSLIKTLVGVTYTIEDLTVAVELNYFDEILPKDYKQKLFEPFDESKEKHRLVTQPINFGQISTPFHSLKLKSHFQADVNEEVIKKLSEATSIRKTNNFETAKTTNNLEMGETTNSFEAAEITNNFETAETTINFETAETTNNFETSKTTNNFEITEKANNNLKASETNDSSDSIFEKLTMTNDNKSIKEERLTPYVVEPMIIDLIEDQSEEYTDFIKQENGFRCPCKVHMNECLLVRCENCKLYQHVYCFDMLIEDHVPIEHICDICAAQDSKLKCTVPELTTMDADSKIHRSIFRLMLGLSFYNNVKPSKEYLISALQLPDSLADELLNRFNQLKLIHKSEDTINRRLFERRTVPSIFRDHSANTEQNETVKPNKLKRYV